ncbi:hypothetical protein [Campylobacter mucosalis]|uniref:hypothetical protein n=1 Tax=Campylobacter mucosalis TaxID=202 RepID=UPI0014708405|nr:hypothetical protein [Campylobacter mucosalis]
MKKFLIFIASVALFVGCAKSPEPTNAGMSNKCDCMAKIKEAQAKAGCGAKANCNMQMPNDSHHKGVSKDAKIPNDKAHQNLMHQDCPMHKH